MAARINGIIIDGKAFSEMFFPGIKLYP
jgi:hypothetical protein